MADVSATVATEGKQSDTGLDQFGFQQDIEDSCPDYTEYALQSHSPYSEGPMRLSFQRPPPHCRRFRSRAVEKVLEDLVPAFKDADLGHIFQNAFPNTLDTTVRWHQPGDQPQSFIVTGDINAEWLRDSTNQLSPYQKLAAVDPHIAQLIKGAINTQTEYVIESPYANAFQPPRASGLTPAPELWNDQVTPPYSPTTVFECKYELDSLANYLALSNDYFAATHDTSFLTPRWHQGLAAVLRVLDEQAVPTFDAATHRLNENTYTFQRTANSGTETLSNAGLGNPLAPGTQLVRSAFRPSDDATVFGFLVPANAMMAVELERTARMVGGEVGEELLARSRAIRKGVMEHGVVQTKRHGEIFAFEVDGFGSALLMDDANVPSLLALPAMGFVDAKDPIYRNTRTFVLSDANPYYLSGKAFSGIGGPHIGLRNAWPMAVLTQALTSESDEEIVECLERVKRISVFGLVNESVDVDTGVAMDGSGMTRPWFAWANAVFSRVILDLAERKPHLIFKNGVRYTVGSGFAS